MQDTTAQRKFFDTYYHYIYAIVYRILRGTGTAEDIEECVSDVFAEYFLRCETVNPDKVKSYLGTTARNKAINIYRSLTRHPFVSLDDDSVPEQASGEDIHQHTEQEEQAHFLLEQIKALGEPDASILIHKFYYDCNSEEIARMLHMTAPAVRTRCSRALKRLKKILTDAGITL